MTVYCKSKHKRKVSQESTIENTHKIIDFETLERRDQSEVLELGGEAVNKRIKMEENGESDLGVGVSIPNGLHSIDKDVSKEGIPQVRKGEGVSMFEKWEGVPKRELIVLLLQSLNGLGYKQACNVLELESGVSLEDPEIVHLHEAVLSGDWDAVFEIMNRLTLHEKVLTACRFIILEQKFLELMFQQRVREAVMCLRDEFRSCCFDEDTTNRLRVCCSLLMCLSGDDLEKRANWTFEGSRMALWRKLQQLFPPDLIPPPKRLISIIHQAWKLQELHCLYHTAPASTEGYPTTHSVQADNAATAVTPILEKAGHTTTTSTPTILPILPTASLPYTYGHIQSNGYPLLCDHECPKGALPIHRVASLDAHVDEVWDVALSHNGQYIASASKDQTVVLWAAQPPFHKIYEWDDYSAALVCVAWSPDDKYLASACHDASIVIWTPKSNSYKWRFSMHQSFIVALSWLPDSRRLVTAEVEKKVKLWKLPTRYANSEVIYQWDFGCRLMGCAVTYNGKYAILATADDSLHILHLETGQELWCLPETDTITSLATSSLSEQFLVSITDPKPEIVLWDLNMRHIVQKYVGHKQYRYVSRAVFGGPNESYVICGCADTMIYIWQRYRGSLLEVISGHTSNVNVAIWPSRANFPLMISASDDNTLALWHCYETYQGLENSETNGQQEDSSEQQNADQSAIANDSGPMLRISW